ncbi:MAG: hypothetical protein J7M25_16875 [Deltaproteobacteria bacterium]|nr:hypothetical protein [Deltaproteobacteria bacterium]
MSDGEVKRGVAEGLSSGDEAGRPAGQGDDFAGGNLVSDARELLDEAQIAFGYGDFRQARALAKKVVEMGRRGGGLGGDSLHESEGSDDGGDGEFGSTPWREAEGLLMQMAPDRVAIGVGIACLVAIFVLAWTYLGR